MLKGLFIVWSSPGSGFRHTQPPRCIGLFFTLYFLLLGAFNSPCLAQSQNILYDQDILKLQKAIRYRVENDSSKNFDEMKDLAFDKVLDTDPNFGWTNGIYWFRTELSKQNDEHYIFEIGYPLLDEVDLFLELNNKLIAHHHLGDQQSRNERLPTSIKPAFKFPTEPGLYRITVRVRSSSSMQVPMSLLREQSYHSKMLEDFAYLFSYTGAVVVMILYNAFIYVSTRSRSYLYYVIFLSLFLALQISLNGFGQNFIWPESWSNFFIAHASFLMNFFVFQFTDSFLDLKSRRSFQKISNLFSAMAALGFVVSLFLNYGIAIKMMAGLTLAGVGFMLYVSTAIAFEDKKREAQLFLLARVFMLFGCIIYIAKQFGLLPYNGFTHNAFLIGSISEIVLLSFALGDRFNRIQKEARVAEHARAEAEEQLNLSLRARVLMVSDMAHRMNNPLNYISTNEASLRREVEELFEDVHHIIDELCPPDKQALSSLARSSVQSRSEMVGNMFEMIEEGLKRSASSVVAIRQLSGVDGYQLDRIRLIDLVTSARRRIVEGLGLTAGQKLHFPESELFQDVYSNLFAVPMVIELAFKNWYESAEPSSNFHIAVSPSTLKQVTLAISFSYQRAEDAKLFTKETLPFLNQILKPYRSALTWTQDSQRLEMVLSFAHMNPPSSSREAA